jgi:hypothetical protein
VRLWLLVHLINKGSRNVTLFFCNINYYFRYIIMKVLSTTASAQTLKIIPREYVSTCTLVLRDDSTNTSVTYSSVSATTNENHLQISKAFSPVLVEGRSYDLTVKNSSNDIIYKDKIFCTAQTVDQSTNSQYTINSGEYTSTTTYDNEFIII